MQYSDELIKQELTRYNTSNQPGVVSDEEASRWKETFINLDNAKIEESLTYIHGRSWYWRKLMQSVEMPANSKVDEVMTQIEALKVFHPEIEIGIQIAMRQMGKPIEDSRIEILEDSKIEEVKEIEVEEIEEPEPESEPEEKPKPKRSRKKKA